MSRLPAIRELIRMAFVTMESMPPHEVDELVIAIAAHLRCIRPEQMSPLGTLPAPGEVIRDPRD